MVRAYIVANRRQDNDGEVNGFMTDGQVRTTA